MLQWTNSEFILIRRTFKVVNVNLICSLLGSVFPLMLLSLCNSLWIPQYAHLNREGNRERETHGFSFVSWRVRGKKKRAREYIHLLMSFYLPPVSALEPKRRIFKGFSNTKDTEKSFPSNGEVLCVRAIAHAHPDQRKVRRRTRSRW